MGNESCKPEYKNKEVDTIDVADNKDNAEGVVEKKSIVLMTGTQMERPLRYLAGLIKEYTNGEYEVDILNLGTKADVYKHKDGGYPEELKQEIIDFLIAKKPEILGITMIDFGVERLSELLKDISQNEEIRKIGTKIVAGGPFANMHPERCIDIEGIDVVCYATGWQFADIVKATSDDSLGNIPGLMIKTGTNEDGTARYDKTPPPKLCVTLSDQPLPDESHSRTTRIHEGHLVNEAESGGAIPVEHHQVPHKHTGVLVVSEGCLNSCKFCAITDTYEAREKQVVQFYKKEAIEAGFSEPLNPDVPREYKEPKVRFLDARQAVDLIKNYLESNPKTEYILFNDNDFMARPLNKIEEFCELYKKEVGLPFYCQCSPNTVKPQKIKALREAGMDTFDVGVQGSRMANDHAGYNRTLITDEHVLNTARSVAPYLEKRDENGEVTEEGLKAAFDFINGNEIQTREDMLSSIALTSGITSEISELTGGAGSWNLAIHNFTIDEDRDLAQEYRKRKEEAGIVSIVGVEDSDYHNANVEAFYKLEEPYLNIVLEWMGGLHDQTRAGRLPRKTEDFATLIQEILVGEPEFAALIDRKKGEKQETVDLLTDEEVYAFLGGKENERAKTILKKISEKVPPVRDILPEWMSGVREQVRLERLPQKSEELLVLVRGVLGDEPEFVALLEQKQNEKPETVDLLIDEEVCAFLSAKENNDRAKAILRKIDRSRSIPTIYYSYQRPNRYDYDYSWAEEQLSK